MSLVQVYQRRELVTSRNSPPATARRRPQLAVGRSSPSTDAVHARCYCSRVSSGMPQGLPWLPYRLGASNSGLSG